MNSFAARRPVAFSIAIILVAELGLAAVSWALDRLAVPRFAGLLIGEACFCGYVAWLLTRLGWWRDAGFRSRVTRRAVLVFAPWLVLVLLMALEDGGRSAGLAAVAATAAFTLMVGFAEEGLLRGVALRALLPGGALRAAVLSALIFGLAHLANILQGRPVGSSVVQAVYATFLGIGLAGSRLAAGTIWPAVTVHALIDFADLAGRDLDRLREPGPLTVAAVVAPLVITGLYALYGWWLIRRWRRSPRAGREETD